MRYPWSYIPPNADPLLYHSPLGKTTVDDILPLPSDARMGSKESGSRSSRGRKGAEVVKDQSDNMEIDIEGL